MSALVEDLIATRDRLKPLTRQGEDYIWRPAKAAVDALADAANALTDLESTRTELEGALEAMSTLCEWFGQREAGVPTTNSEAAMFRRVDYAAAQLEARFGLTPNAPAFGAAKDAQRKSGWVLVPREPKPEMLAAFWRVKNGHYFHGDPPPTDTSDYAAYRAMIAAALAKSEGADR